MPDVGHQQPVSNSKGRAGFQSTSQALVLCVCVFYLTDSNREYGNLICREHIPLFRTRNHEVTGSSGFLVC